MMDFAKEALIAELERERAAHIVTLRELDAARETIISMQRNAIDDAALPTPDCTGTEFINDLMGRLG